MKKCAHTYIVKVMDCFIHGEKLCIVLQYANGRDLQREINRRALASQAFSETEILTYFSQICLALRRVHKSNLIHRDCKPGNIFLHNSGSGTIALLGDFGITKQLSTLTKSSKTFTGTPGYFSPEQINRQSYDQRTDIFALGSVLYAMCALKPAFDGPTDSDVEQAILHH